MTTMTQTDVFRDALSELTSFEERIPSGDALDAATKLPDWNVEALVRHVAAVAWQQAESLHRARLGIGQTPSYLTVDVERAELPAAVRTARAYLESAISSLEGDPIVPLPFATLPASFAAYVLLIEYGVHAYDLDLAVGTERDLTPSLASAVLDLMGAMLPMFSGERPDGRVSLAIESNDGRRQVVSWTGDGWQATGPDEPDCTITGSPSAVALFALGRIDSEHPSIQVGGDASLARRFKSFFPGP